MPRSKPAWTKEQDSLLLSLIEQKTPSEKISVCLGRTRNAVESRARRLGSSVSLNCWTDEQVSLLRSCVSQGKTIEEMVFLLGVTRKRLRPKLNHLGINSFKSQSRKEQKDLRLKGLKRCPNCKEIKPLNTEYFVPPLVYCIFCEPVLRNKRRISSLKSVLNSRLKGAKATSKKKGREFNLTLDCLLDLLEKQEGKCFYTGEIMTVGGEERSTFTSAFSISIDRVDSSKEYVEGNVVLCCWRVNQMKSEFSVEDLKFWCERISSCKNKIV